MFMVNRVETNMQLPPAAALRDMPQQLCSNKERLKKYKPYKSVLKISKYEPSI